MCNLSRTERKATSDASRTESTSRVSVRECRSEWEKSRAVNRRRLYVQGSEHDQTRCQCALVRRLRSAQERRLELLS